MPKTIASMGKYNINKKTFGSVDPNVVVNILEDLAYAKMFASYAGLDASNDENLGYDLSARPNLGSNATLDVFTTNSIGVINAGDISISVDFLDLDTITVGEEVTIFDDVNMERKIITSLDFTNKTIGLDSALVYSYKSSACIARSSPYILENINKINNSLKMRGWQTKINTSGYGSKIANPATSISSQVNGTNFHPNGNFVALACSSSPYLLVYAFDSNTIGAKSNDPATLPTGSCNKISFHPNGNFIAVAHTTSPYLSVYPFDPSTGAIGVKIANPTTLPAGTGFGIAFSPNGNFIAVAHNNSPYLSVYPFDPSTGAIGVKIANPTTLPAGQGNGITFHPNGNFIVVAHTTTPYFSVYPFDPSTGAIGVRLANSSQFPAGSSQANSASFSPNGNFLAIGHSGSPYISIYGFDSATSSIKGRLNNPLVLPNGSSLACFHPSGNFIGVAHSSSPYMSMYAFDSNLGEIGNKIVDPYEIPTGSGKDINFHPNRNFIAVGHSTSPYMSAYPWTSYDVSPVLVEDFRYSIYTNNTTKSILILLEYPNIDDSIYKIDAYISSVLSSSNESYRPMRKIISVKNTVKELRFHGNITNSDKVTIRFTITRINTSAEREPTKLLTIPQ